MSRLSCVNIWYTVFAIAADNHSDDREYTYSKRATDAIGEYIICELFIIILCIFQEKLSIAIMCYYAQLFFFRLEGIYMANCIGELFNLNFCRNIALPYAAVAVSVICKEGIR